MNFSFSEEQEAVRELARQIFSDACSHETLAELERDESGDGIHHALWRSLAEANLLGVAIDEANGGSGFGFSALGVLLEEAGRCLAPLPLVPSLAIAAPAIGKFGSEAQKKRWLPGVASGETLLTAALQETGPFAPTRPRTVASARGDGWALEGEKVCVPCAPQAARILLTAQTGEGRVGVFLVDPNAEGVRLGRGVANNHERQFELSLSGVEVAAEDCLGDPGDAGEIIPWIVDRAQAALASLQLGVCESALARTAEYTSERKQFGRAIGTFQAVTMRLADAFVDLECMKSALWQAIWKLEQELPAAADAAAAKWWACRAGQRVVHSAQHLHGGIGVDTEYPIHRYFLWAKALEIELGGASQSRRDLGRLLASNGAGRR